MIRGFTLPRAPEREMGGPGTVHHALSPERLAAASPTLAAERRLTAIRGQARFYPEGDAAWLLARYDALAGAARALVDSDTGPGLSAEWAALMALLPPEDPR